MMTNAKHRSHSLLLSILLFSRRVYDIRRRVGAGVGGDGAPIGGVQFGDPQFPGPVPVQRDALEEVRAIHVRLLAITTARSSVYSLNN